MIIMCINAKIMLNKQALGITVFIGGQDGILSLNDTTAKHMESAEIL